MKNFRFLDWQVYKEAQDVLISVRALVLKVLPSDQRYIGSQILRSALSVVLNIAEGSGKSSEKELVRYIDIALGSLYETRAAVDVLCRLSGLPTERAKSIEDRMLSISKQLGGLRKNAKAKPPS